MSENTVSNGEGRIVSVTQKGQATIPKQLREKHGIPAPGCVKFVENDQGEIIVRPVGSMREFRGLDRDETDRPATAILREERKRDEERLNDLVDRTSDE